MMQGAKSGTGIGTADTMLMICYMYISNSAQCINLEVRAHKSRMTERAWIGHKVLC
jgi:hypothetical protein